MENDSLCKIIGIGDIILETNTSCRLTLKNVRHVPNIGLNLVLTGKLNDKGYPSKFWDEKWKLSKGSVVITYGNKKGPRYKTQVKLYKEEVNIAGILYQPIVQASWTLK